LRNQRNWAQNNNSPGTGDLEVPIAATFALDGVRAAFEQLEQGHTRGKIILLP